MKKRYKQRKKKNTKKPFDALAKHLPPRIPTSHTTTLPSAARIDLPNQTVSRSKPIPVSPLVFFPVPRCPFFPLVSPTLTVFPLHLFFSTLHFEPFVHRHWLRLISWIFPVHTPSHLAWPGPWHSSNMSLGPTPVASRCAYELPTLNAIGRVASQSMCSLARTRATCRCAPDACLRPGRFVNLALLFLYTTVVRRTRLFPLAFVYLDGNPNGGVPPRKWHCVAYFNANEYDLLPGPEAYPELRDISIPPGVYTSTKGMGRATAAITGGALRPVASGLGNASMGSVGNYGSTMGVLDIGGISGGKAGADVDWDQPGDDAEMEIDAYRGGDGAKGAGVATEKVYGGRPQEPQTRLDLEHRSSSAGALPMQYQYSRGAHGHPLVHSGSLSSTSTSTSRGSPDSPEELAYTSGRYSQGSTSNPPSMRGSDYFHGAHAHSHSHLGNATTFSRSASYSTQPTSSTYPTHTTLPPSTVLPLPNPRPSWAGASGSRTARSSEDAKAINAFRLAL